MNYAMMNKILIISMSPLIFLMGCANVFSQNPEINRMEFLIFPRIVQVNDAYFLQYQVKLPTDNNLNLKRVVYSKTDKNKGIYYFSQPISHPERGDVIEIPIHKKMLKYVHSDAVYWMDGGTEVKLEIVHEPH